MTEKENKGVCHIHKQNEPCPHCNDQEHGVHFVHHGYFDGSKKMKDTIENSGVTCRVIGQKWMLWNLGFEYSDHVTMTTDEGDKLVLVNVIDFKTQGGVKNIPVKREDLELFRG